jgi:uncharacterized protein
MRPVTRVLCALLLVALPAAARANEHRLVIHVDSDRAEVMTEALHNATNVIGVEGKHGEPARIEIVANGPGIAMLIGELSPVKDEIRRLHAAHPQIVLSACGISLAHTEQAMKRHLSVVPEARVVPSGAVRIMELEERGWAYLKP